MITVWKWNLLWEEIEMTIKVSVIVLAALGSLYAIFLNVVRRRSANNPTPESVSDVYDAETYARWKSYNAEHCKLELIFAILTGVVSLAMLFTNVYAAFASLFPTGIYEQLLAVVILEFSVGFVLEIPRTYIATMVIEQKYGFNRSTMKTFIADRIRSAIFGALFSFLLAYLMAKTHAWVGDYLMLLFAGMMFLIMLLVTFLYPVFSRIGNKFVPLEEGELKDRLMALLTKHGYRVKAIEVMDASRRTTKLNAYFTGFGKMKTIVLYDNLLNAMTPDEICAVFAHELGHGLHKDVLKQQTLNIVQFLLIGALVWLVVRDPVWCEAFGFTGVNYGFAYVLVGVGLGVLQPLIALLSNAVSRRAEYRADRQAVKEGYGEAMITAFKKLARDNFAHLAPSPINVVLEYSHPPLHLRVQEVEKAMKEE